LVRHPAFQQMLMACGKAKPVSALLGREKLTSRVFFALLLRFRELLGLVADPSSLVQGSWNW
jgi:hypothetical protein